MDEPKIPVPAPVPILLIRPSTERFFRKPLQTRMHVSDPAHVDAAVRGLPATVDDTALQAEWLTAAVHLGGAAPQPKWRRARLMREYWP